MASSDLNKGSCPICASERSHAFRARIMRKYDVDYFYCHRCGLLQTERPWWLEEAYQRAIADADTGIAARNYAASRRLAAFLLVQFGAKARFVDSAGGYGLLTRLMRDVGYDFYWHDPYCENIFARGFEAPDGKFKAITALEVLEHTPDPLQFVRGQLSKFSTRTMIFTTQLFKGDPPPLDWWYYAFGTGQHVSFYQRRTLRLMAEALGLKLVSHGTWHMPTDERVNALLFSALTSRGSSALAPAIRLWVGSKTMDDHRALMGSGAGGGRE